MVMMLENNGCVVSSDDTNKPNTKYHSSAQDKRPDSIAQHNTVQDSTRQHETG
jgi:hypothetical protein